MKKLLAEVGVTARTLWRNYRPASKDDNETPAARRNRRNVHCLHALREAMAKQRLHGAQVLGASVHQRRLGSPHRMLP